MCKCVQSRVQLERCLAEGWCQRACRCLGSRGHWDFQTKAEQCLWLYPMHFLWIQFNFSSIETIIPGFVHAGSVFYHRFIIPNSSYEALWNNFFTWEIQAPRNVFLHTIYTKKHVPWNLGQCLCNSKWQGWWCLLVINNYKKIDRFSCIRVIFMYQNMPVGTKELLKNSCWTRDIICLVV